MGEKILFCPRCGEAMIKQSQDFWKCPKCGGEWWPDEDKLAYLEEERRAHNDPRVKLIKIARSFARAVNAFKGWVRKITPLSKG